MKYWMHILTVVLALAMAAGRIEAASAAPTGRSVSGKVVDAKSGEYVAGVVVTLDGNYLWAVSDEKGAFLITNVQAGTYSLKASYLGYVDVEMSLAVKDDIEGLVLKMQESSLALDEVLVTAQRTGDGLNTSHTLGRDALNHLQMSSVTDMSALLPGGKTINPDLTTENSFALRAGGAATAANAAFGTALEVDGVRLGNNAGLAGMGGVDTRSLPVDNVENIEVITGVPSAEYGDLNGGMVRIHTRKGRTPLNVSFSVNPRTYQASLSKGIGLGEKKGVLNVSGEWARATKKLVSPYESYSRRGASMSYSNTFANALRFEIGANVNVGGMDSKDDPDAFTGEYKKVRDNAVRANTSLSWLLNKSWVTSLKLDASLNYADNLSHIHSFNSYGSVQPAVHSEYEGYYIASQLPLTFFADEMTDSKELDYAASFKYELHKRWDGVRNNVKAGVQWKANGNVGEGEYYLDPTTAANGYRPRPYSQYPFMHNLSAYAEDNLSIPLGTATLDLTAGLRMENVFIDGSDYKGMNTLSPRFNARLKISEHFALRGGWGVTEKLPSFYILYPRQEYRDIQTAAFSYGTGASYIYYTQPYELVYNPELRWQRANNSEFGLEGDVFGVDFSIVGYYNKTLNPYEYSNLYAPFSYDMVQIADGYVMPSDPQFKVDNQTGMVYIRGDKEVLWTPMATKLTDRTFVKTQKQDNGSPVTAAGVELTMDFPEIKPIKTSLRLDASYNYSSYNDESLSYYYSSGASHTSLPGRSYQYVGIYANGGSSNAVVSGKITHDFDANLTAITHIPQARLVVTCRLEMNFLTRTRNIADRRYVFTCTQESKTPTGGNIYDGNSYTVVWPVAYMDLDGSVHEFTAEQAADPAFSNLLLRSANAYTFAQDGYGFYCSANLSITKEIGDHVSLSFFANNFTNSRPFVLSKATGVGAIFTPAFYYGLTCRLKF